MTAAMRELAAELAVPVVCCLEGGYAVGALAASVVETLRALEGEDQPREAPPGFAAPFRERLAPYWPVLG
jgi:acetoin utilization deacetylase AcuC-like enzyme